MKIKILSALLLLFCAAAVVWGKSYDSTPKTGVQSNAVNAPIGPTGATGTKATTGTTGTKAITGPTSRNGAASGTGRAGLKGAPAGTGTDANEKLADTSKWGLEWVLVFSPLVLLLIFLLLAFRWLRDFKLNEALTENSPSQKIENNKEYSLANINTLLTLNAGSATSSLSNILPPTVTVSDVNNYRPSISRLIVFITSILALILGLSLSCFLIYNNLRGSKIPDIGQLSSLMLALGIGVAPYAFNKVSSAISAGKQPTT